jgi:hypothetical protein
VWYVDSDLFARLTGDVTQLSRLQSLRKPVLVEWGNGSTGWASHMGSVTLHGDDEFGDSLSLSTVLYVPGAAVSLMSVPEATATGNVAVVFGENSTVICSDALRITCPRTDAGMSFLVNNHRSGMTATAYFVSVKAAAAAKAAQEAAEQAAPPAAPQVSSQATQHAAPQAAQHAAPQAAQHAAPQAALHAAPQAALHAAPQAAPHAAPQADAAKLWHRRFAHMGYSNLSKVVSMVDGFVVPPAVFAAQAATVCEPCVAAKQHCVPHPSTSTVSTQPLQLLHTDLCRPMPVTALDGCKYFVTVLDGLLQAGRCCASVPQV